MLKNNFWSTKYSNKHHNNTPQSRHLLLPGEVLAVAVLVRPFEVLELLARPGALEVLVLLGGVLLRVVDAVLHHVLEAADQTYCKEKVVKLLRTLDKMLGDRQVQNQGSTKHNNKNKHINYKINHKFYSPCTGQAAASPRAQIVWPSMAREISSNMGISRRSASPCSILFRIVSIQPVPGENEK